MTITIEQYDNKVSFQMPDDSSIADVAMALRGMLITIGYSGLSVNEYITPD